MVTRSGKDRHVVGVMTGSSIDGIDAALVSIQGTGLAIQATLVRHVARPLGDLTVPLRAASEQKPMTAGEFAQLAWEFGRLHAETIAELPLPDHPPDLICVHGQTVFHQPPISWQLINPAPIAQQFKCPVVSDLRQADLAAGGQGAPITPLADWIMFRSARKSRAIVNLGGFCNVTIILPLGEAAAPTRRTPHELAQIRGFDVCSCNQVLNAVARMVLDVDFDHDGQAAQAGQANDEACAELLAALNHQRCAGRSLGTRDEIHEWIARYADRLPPHDFAATAVESVAQCIATALNEQSVDEVILAGGGAKNRTLAGCITRHTNAPTRLSDELGIPVQARESMAMAILGALSADGVPITLPKVTGGRNPAPVAGLWSVIGQCDRTPCMPGERRRGSIRQS